MKKAGCTEVDRVLRGLGLAVSRTGRGHACVVDGAGEPLRLPDGRRLQVSSSPSNPSVAARRLLNDLRKLGVA